jgi:DNA-binding NarL/FixJ family response regulator
MSPEIAAKAFMLYREVREKPGDQAVLPLWKAPIPFADLSRIELQVIDCIAQALANKEIAAKLQLKEGTVRNYITSVLQKTGLKSRTQIAAYANNAGLMAVEKEPILHE